MMVLMNIMNLKLSGQYAQIYIYGAEYMKLKIAFLQLVPEGNLEDNLEKGIKACREAKANGADIALFPEMWSSGYTFPHNKEWLEQNSISSDSKYVKQFSEISLKLDMAIAITLLEKHEPKPRNTVCLFDRHGKLVYCYSKVHICDFGEDDDEGVLDAGENFYVEELDTKEGLIKVGSMICYDREFPESARILMIKGAELILVPNACPMEINRLSQLRGRAYENMLAIATCNYPAPHRGCNGHSTLFDGVIYNTETGVPRDMLVSETGDEEGVFLAELDVDMLRKYRSCEIGGLKKQKTRIIQAYH